MTVTAPAGRARGVLYVDAAGEAVLTLGVVALAYRLPVGGSWALPGWLGRPLLIVIAVLLAVAAAALAWLAEHHDAPTLRAVATANAVTAIVLLAWAGLDGGAGAWLRIAAAVVALALLGLAWVQRQVSRPG